MLSIDNTQFSTRVIKHQHLPVCQYTTPFLLSINKLKLELLVVDQRLLRRCQFTTFSMLSINNTQFSKLVLDRQHDQGYQSGTHSCSYLPPSKNWHRKTFKLETGVGNEQHGNDSQWTILDMLSIYNEQCENCVLSIDNIDKVVNWQRCRCYRSTARLFQNVLSIDNIFQFFNRQPHFCCQSTTYNLNYFSSIKNISNVLN